MKRFLSLALALLMVVSMLPVSALAAERTTDVYLEPGVWDVDGAWYAIYYWNDSTSGWVNMIDSDGDGMYESTVPAGYSNVIFVRMNPAYTDFTWDAKWNQTADLTLGSGNLYTISGWGTDESTGSWSTYTPVVEPEETTAPTTEATEPTEEEVVPDGSIANPYVYDSVDALVADWTERTIGAGEIVCVQAPLGGETLTITSDTTAACIANPRSYGAYAYDSEPFTFDEYWTEGEVIVIGIYNQNPNGDAVVTLVSGAVEDGGDDDDDTTTTTALTMGNNSINAEDVTFTYTAAEDGVLTLSLGVAIMGDVSAQVYVSGKESKAVTLNVSSSLDLAMSNGETAYIAFTAAGYATLAASWSASESGEDTGDDDGVLASDTVKLAADESVVYSFTPEVGGNLTVTVSSDAGWDVTISGGNLDNKYWSDTDTSPLTEELVGGFAYTVTICPYDEETEGSVDATITYEITFEPTQDISDILITGKVADGDNSIELALAGNAKSTYSYTATQTGTLYATVTYYAYDYGYGMYDNTDWIADEFGYHTSLMVNDTALEGVYYGSVEVVEGETYEFTWSNLTGCYAFEATLNLNYDGYAISLPGSAESPYEIDSWQVMYMGDQMTEAVPAGSSLYYMLYSFSGNNITVSGDNVSVVYNGETYEAVDGVVTIYADSDEMLLEICNNGEEAAYYTIGISYPLGAEQNPEIITLTDNGDGTYTASGSVELEDDTTGYYYTLTAPAEGKLNITMTSAGWTYSMTNDTLFIGGDYYDSGSEPAVPSSEVVCYEGDTIIIYVSTAYDNENWYYPAGTVSFTLTLTAGEVVQGTADFPYSINTGDTPLTVEIGAGETSYFELSYFNGKVLTVTGENAYVIYNGETYEAVDGVVSVQIGSSDYSALVQIGNSGDSAASFEVDYHYPLGEYSNPEVITEMGEHTANITGNAGYYYNWYAEEDGTLTITLLTEASGSYWRYYMQNATTWSAYSTHNYNDDPIVTTDTVTVSAGDKVKIWVNNYDRANYEVVPGEISFTLSFAAASTEPDETEPDVTEPDVTEPEETGKTVTKDLCSGTATADDDSKWTYRFVPEVDGTLTITVGDGTTAWTSDVYSFKTFSAVGTLSGSEEATYTADVQAGTTYFIRIYATDGGALAATPYSVTFTYVDTSAGEDDDSVTVDSGTDVEITGDEKSGIYDDIVIAYTPEENGYLTIHMISGDPGWYYTIQDVTARITGSTEATGKYEVYAGKTYNITIGCYDPSEYINCAGTVSYEVKFLASEDVVAPKEAYVISDTVITEEGTYEVAMEYADVTIVTITPDEAGYYEITVNTDGATIANCGSIATLLTTIPDSSEFGTKIEWLCEEGTHEEEQTILDESGNEYITITQTVSGQSILVGILSESENVSITLTKTADYTKTEIELQTYVNKAELSDFNMGSCFTLGDYVDVYGDTHTAVLGTDGYYHLDSADGDILLIDLDYICVLTEALYGGRGVMYAYVYDEEGNLAEKWDIGNAVRAYEDVATGDGYYPLTEDLIFFYDTYASANGVYQFYLEEGYNEDCVWMFACRTATVEHDVENGTCTGCGKVFVEITEQPEDAIVASGKVASTTVTAEGKDLTYTWYVLDPGATEWVKSSVTKATYSVKMTAAKSGRQVYCVVTDANGYEVATEIATLSMATLEITKQPTSVTVAEGKTASVSVEVAGTGELTYKWYFAAAGSSKFYLTTSFTGPTYSVAMNSTRNGRQVYCVISDAYGNSVTTDTVTLNMATLEITKQPTSVTVAEGKTASVSVEVAGTGELTYQWYWAAAGSSKFYLTTSFTGPTYSVAMNSTRNGRQIYCVISDSYGNSVTTDTVTLNMATLEITKQPVSVTVKEGETATVTVGVSGTGTLTYKWYFANSGSSSFAYTSTFSGNTYTAVMNSTRNGRKIYCVISDAYGNSVTTNTVTINMAAETELKITKQPANATVASGKVASTTVTAEGDGLTYTWYVLDPGASSWVKSSITKSTYSVAMTAAKSGRHVYCVVTDTNGNSVKTNIVTLNMTTDITISSQPANTAVSAGSVAKATVTASGDGLTYTWYVLDPGSSTWVKSSITKSTYSVALTAAKSGRQVYCVITDADGNSVATNIVTMSTK